MNGRIINVNNKFCEVTGYSRTELIGQSHRLLKSNVHLDAFYAELWSTIKRGEIWRNEICNKKKNGELYWLDCSIVPILNESGKIIRYMSVRYDITAHKQAKEKLYATSRYARNLIETSLDPLVTINTAGKITDVNQATEHITGVSRNVLIGDDFSDYFTNPDDARKGYEIAFREGLVKNYPLTI